MTTITSNKEIFQASWPKSLEPTVSKKIANFVWNTLCATVLLPVGVARVLNHWIIRPIIIENFIDAGIKRHKSHKFANKPISFKMANGQTIKGTFLQGHGHGKKLIILSCGSGQWCEKVERHPALLESGVSILAINNPGVGTSKSYPGIDGLDVHKSFGLATFSAFELATQTKLNEGKHRFHKKDILFYGYSLGGAAATIGAGYVEETYGEKPSKDGKKIEKLKVKLINDRSFNNLNKLAIARILRIKNAPFKALRFAEKISKCITFFIPNFLIRISVYSTTFLAGIRLDPETAFKKLKTEKKCVIFSKKDPTIPYKGGSLFKSIKNSKTTSCKGIKLDDGYDHLKTFEGEAKNATLQCVQKYLNLPKRKSFSFSMADT